MGNLGIASKAHTAIDITVAYLTGWYRVRIAGPQPATNANHHYIKTADEIKSRIDEAIDGVYNAHTLATIYSASELLQYIRNPKICDFGGAYGEACLRFQRYIPEAVCTVVEIPEIVSLGKSEKRLKTISFSTSLPDACDVLFSSGVVMNAHEALFDAIKTMNAPNLIISSVEITDKPTYWSMVFYRRTKRKCPYITFNRQEFIDKIEDMGYILKDAWHQGRNNSGVFLNGQKSPDAYSFVFIRNGSERQKAAAFH